MIFNPRILLLLLFHPHGYWISILIAEYFCKSLRMRQFLRNRLQLCKQFALLTPRQFYDFLEQIELIQRFAGKVPAVQFGFRTGKHAHIWSGGGCMIFAQSNIFLAHNSPFWGVMLHMKINKQERIVFHGKCLYGKVRRCKLLFHLVEPW